MIDRYWEITDSVFGLLLLSFIDFKIHRLAPLHWHWHEEFQLTFVLSGTLELSVGKETYQIHEKSGIIINSRRLHHAIPLT
jgi:quercetin dioxygenase-like cupin family protein